MPTVTLRSLRPRLVAGVLSLGVVAGACGPRTVVVSSVPAGSREAPAAAPGDAAPASSASSGWGIATREHVDLWLHGFAMLQADSSLVPPFRLAYRQEASQARRAAGTTSLLDGNAVVLARRLQGNPSLASAHFLALYFPSWDDLRRGVQRFLRAGGTVRAAESQEELRMFATIGTYFPAAADRDWLRLFVESLDDERGRFFTTWWRQEQAARAGVRGQVEAMWRTRQAAAFARVMHGTGQRRGTIILSPVLGGEGRSIDVGRNDNFITVTFPAAGGDFAEAFYVIAHEATGAVSNAVVRDNTTPADETSGETGRLSTIAAVVGGALLLERVSPELADGYRRFYLRGARQVPANDVTAQFARIFPLPSSIVTALQRQLDLVLNGI